MKIVCDACQAKYSIADEKVQGKAFKIRCKKCGHIIVVRQGADKPAAAADKPAATADQQGVWYIVVEGEQVGPLAEADIAGRLSRGEINPDTLIWKDGLADWVKISTVPELSDAAAAAQPAAASAEAPGETTPPPAAVIPARRRTSARMQVAKEPARAAAPAEDVFRPASAAPGAADLFAPSIAMPSPVNEPTAAPFSFGASAAPAPEPVPQQAPSNNGAGGSHLTGQRNENSVLFSLSNLEALAVPSGGSSNARPPSTTGTTEGSGLIDIRSMAARTIGQSNRSESPSAMDSLPTFSTPQFSPVAPVLLPMAPSGPPKWVYPVLGVLGLGIVALGFGIYKVVSAPPPAPPPQIVVPGPAAPVAAPAPAAAPAAPAAAAPAAPAAAAPEDKAGDDKSADKKKPSGSKGGKTASKSSGEGSAKPASDTSKKGAAPEPAPAPAPTAAKPAGRKGSIEDLLDQVGTKKSGGEPKPVNKAPSAAPLPALSQSDIVNAMKGVQPRVKECFNQYKQAGIANVSISVAKGGRVASATVSGKFAGTPSGSCVEAAAKTAKFPPCESMSFPWPFQLH
jgi:predicted Zn finger-like uncharacterized protein